MLDILSEGFKKASLHLQGKTELTESNIAEAMTTVRQSLLEADVEYSVVKNFVTAVKAKTLGEEVSLKAGKGQGRLKVKASDHFIKICQDELVGLMGPVDTSLHYAVNRPTTVMMVGLQGTGKTTTTGKLAHFLKTSKKKKPLLVACDIYRAAAVSQLKVLGQRINVPVFSKDNATPLEIATSAIAYAYENHCDLVLFDTAGRLTIDEALMQELSDIKTKLKPDNILLVCDAMMGQDAVTTAKTFDDLLDLSGFILTKLDGDARGGAALSIKQVIGKPIKFIGMGEELERLEEFRPEGLASRILGLGDVVGLMQDFERVATEDQEQDTLKLLSGKFNFKDFYSQISMIQKMGPLKDIIAKMPMQNLIPKEAVMDDRELIKIKAMIDSMTEKERLAPDLINESRAKRISKGSGRSVKELSELLKKFKAMRQMMGMMGKNLGVMGKIPGLGQLSQMNQMRKMMKGGGAGGGMPDFGSMMEAMGGAGMPPPSAFGAADPLKRLDKDKLKKARKDAKKSRQKNRKR